MINNIMVDETNASLEISRARLASTSNYFWLQNTPWKVAPTHAESARESF